MASMIQHSSASDSWMTPLWLIELVHKVLGGIDLDPASSTGANEFIKAGRIYTKEDNALEGSWDLKDESVFINPPGGKIRGKSVTRLFWEKFIRETEDNLHFRGGIFLAFNINALQTTQASLTPMCQYRICIPSKRISFISPDNNEFAYSPCHASAIIYVPGSEDCEDLFEHVFKDIGAVL